MKISDWTGIIACCISFVELIVIGLLTFAAFRMNSDYNSWQRQMIEDDRVPVPILESSCISPLGEHCRYYYKEKIPGIDANGQIPIYEFDEETVNTFLNKKQSAYFSDVFGKKCIVINMLNDEHEILLEHCPTKVTCKNIGGEFQSLKIESVYMEFLNGSNVTLRGSDDSIACPTSKGGTFEFYLDEISNGSNEMCKINNEVLEIMKPGLNIIGTDFKSYVFDYTKSVIRVSFIKGTDSYTYDIGVERKDNKLVPIQERIS